ncbi:unnamed protein product [Brassicogethes aeneus]|uniref:DUF4806 domain-containing protein n=1 Tax=Brassicogethes aeneus TaxID=1431903 RepID=A0A9P0AP27_BRAAE|nr:unnamed protein product [Brassicogethes aeneus]
MSTTYLGIQFEEQDGPGSIALIINNWLTPRKKEVFWPPYKTQFTFNRALEKKESAQKNWTLYKVSRIFFECDNLVKAREKLKQAEFSSDLQSDAEETLERRKRKIVSKRRLYESDEDDLECRKTKIVSSDTSTNNSDEENSTRTGGFIPRPPKLDKRLFSDKSRKTPSACGAESLNINAESTTVEPSTSSEAAFPAQSTPSILSYSSKSSFELALLDPENPVIKYLATIKAQSDQIINLLNKQQSALPITKFSLPGDLPTTLPIKTAEDFALLETYLENKDHCVVLVAYLSSLGGEAVSSVTNSILRACVSLNLAQTFSWLGTRQQKEAFSKTNLKNVVIDAVKNSVTTTTDKVENAIKVWLKHAPDNYKIEQKRLEKQNNGEGEVL